MTSKHTCNFEIIRKHRKKLKTKDIELVQRQIIREIIKSYGE